MSNIGTIALFLGVAIAGVIVWEIRRAPRVELAVLRPGFETPGWAYSGGQL